MNNCAFAQSTPSEQSAAVDKSQQHQIWNNLAMPRIKPETAGWEAWTLPLCYAPSKYLWSLKCYLQKVFLKSAGVPALQLTCAWRPWPWLRRAWGRGWVKHDWARRRERGSPSTRSEASWGSWWQNPSRRRWRPPCRQIQQQFLPVVGGCSEFPTGSANYSFSYRMLFSLRLSKLNTISHMSCFIHSSNTAIIKWSL